MNMNHRSLTTCLCLAAAIALVSTSESRAQTLSADRLVASLRQGGCVLVMRHASSPREAPDRQTANSDNVKMERQLDERGQFGGMYGWRDLQKLKANCA